MFIQDARIVEIWAYIDIKITTVFFSFFVFISTFAPKKQRNPPYKQYLICFKAFQFVIAQFLTGSNQCDTTDVHIIMGINVMVIWGI